MPELPEVEIARRNLERWFRGHSLKKAVGTKTRIFRGAKVSDFEKLQGPLTEAARKGKYLMLRFGDRGVLAHLGMTGKFVRRAHDADEPFSRAKLLLDDGQVIHFKDARMFGRIEPATSAALAELKAIKQLGFDPFTEGVDGAKLKDALARSKQDLKVALMDQSRMAGMGNIHAAEALYRAKLHPARKPASLSDDEWSRLAEGVKATIAFALSEEESDEPRYVEESNDPADNPFLVYGHGGEACKVCGSVIKQFAQGGRSTYFCPGCQPAKKSPKPKQAKKPAKRMVRAKSAPRGQRKGAR